MRICFATNNQNKLKEVKEILGSKFDIIGLKDLGIEEELPETHETLEENALEKASYVYEKTGVNCFADDTGLETDALHGAPGVYSARYAGIPSDSNKNIDLLLQNMHGIENRNASFRTVIALIIAGQHYNFEGIAKGKLTNERSGNEGFGYDPIFIPKGHDITFAEMSLESKNEISHRGKAVRQLTDFLKNLQ